MASYIAWYGKKRARLAKHERKFTSLLLTTTDAARLADGAEIVRAAHVRALKAIRGQLAPRETNAEAFAKLDIEIQFWLALSAQELIEGYRTGNLKGHPPTSVRRRIKRAT
jgi:hypothetical protein